MIIPHPGEICFRQGTQVSSELIAIATTVMHKAALDLLALGTIRAMNMAYKAMPIELLMVAGRIEQARAPIAVPMAHPQ